MKNVSSLLTKSLNQWSTDMNTQEQILNRLSELRDERRDVLNEVALLDGVISFWEEQLDSHKALTVHHTYTDTPLAEEYYGG